MTLEYTIENGGSYNYTGSFNRQDCIIIKRTETRMGIHIKHRRDKKSNPHSTQNRTRKITPIP